ncbi:tetratricopeptide repeat protein [Leeuwenhoekiella polynyae]|uniref:Tetratricopeptide repeat protein n=1 Tax=Leeuwenhoekiella polynyae TaxID=1550906 RepID=A0A4Q0PI55_9FLAO|nr:tetratricopeptide repeat protein [Leeuwenhoekiella polynyae]RXG26380.1 tetratricopeptide repeat protein [Leeuwenhoekiella polynyae]
MKAFIILLITLLFSPLAEAQEPNPLQDVNVDDLEDVTDDFQESFFEALKQKGIENYDRAIAALDKCIALRPQEPILYFEKGKNEAALGNVQEAENNYLKALQLKPNQRDMMESLYEVYYARQDFDKAIDLVQDLVKFDIRYKEDLARIYVRKGAFEKALTVLDELDDNLGKDAYRSQIREQALALSGGDVKERVLLKEIDADPENEQNYLNLIYVYSEQGNTDKAYVIAQRLLKINPKADAVHLALYKFHLENGDVQQAFNSLEKVMKSSRIEPKAKHSVLNDFLIYVDRNPEYEPELEQAIALFSSEEQTDVNEELGAYYLKNKDSTKALSYYEAAYKKDVSDINVLRNLIMLQLQASQFDKAAALSEEALMLYPAQALFYLVYGVAQNGLGNTKEAADYLEMGLDYIIDNPKMQADFYSELARAYDKLGNAAKAADYRKRLTNLTQ